MVSQSILEEKPPNHALPMQKKKRCTHLTVTILALQKRVGVGRNHDVQSPFRTHLPSCSWPSVQADNGTAGSEPMLFSAGVRCWEEGFIQQAPRALLWMAPSQFFQKRERKGAFGAISIAAAIWHHRICPYFLPFTILTHLAGLMIVSQRFLPVMGNEQLRRAEEKEELRKMKRMGEKSLTKVFTEPSLIKSTEKAH